MQIEILLEGSTSLPARVLVRVAYQAWAKSPHNSRFVDARYTGGCAGLGASGYWLTARGAVLNELNVLVVHVARR